MDSYRLLPISRRTMTTTAIACAEGTPTHLPHTRTASNEVSLLEFRRRTIVVLCLGPATKFTDHCFGSLTSNSKSLRPLLLIMSLTKLGIPLPEYRERRRSDRHPYVINGRPGSQRTRQFTVTIVLRARTNKSFRSHCRKARDTRHVTVQGIPR